MVLEIPAKPRSCSSDTWRQGIVGGNWLILVSYKRVRMRMACCPRETDSAVNNHSYHSCHGDSSERLRFLKSSNGLARIFGDVLLHFTVSLQVKGDRVWIRSLSSRVLSRKTPIIRGANKRDISRWMEAEKQYLYHQWRMVSWLGEVFKSERNNSSSPMSAWIDIPDNKLNIYIS